MTAPEHDHSPQGRGGARVPVALVQLIPNMVTLAGLSLGLTAIHYVIEGRFGQAALLILLAAVFDGVDGLLARRLRASSELGAQLDSLSDLIAFGVAPAVLVYQFHLQTLGGTGWIFVLVFVAASALRLARFNMTSGQSDIRTEDRESFTGVPMPAAALLGLLPSYLVLAGFRSADDWPLAVALWLGLVAGLMVSTLRTVSPKAVKVRPGQVVLVFLVTVVMVGMTLSRPWALLVLVDLAYLAHVIVAALRARVRQAR